jgi:hypothetical protein
MIPMITSSDLVIRFKVANIMQVNPGELHNEAKAYHESINDLK